jgi:hypothetical protein
MYRMCVCVCVLVRARERACCGEKERRERELCLRMREKACSIPLSWGKGQHRNSLKDLKLELISFI